MYHLQFGNSWNLETVCETLRLHCVDASIVGGCIRIRLPDEKRPTIITRFLGFLSFRRSKQIWLKYDLTKFIRNVDLEDLWPRTRMDSRCFDDIHSAMLKMGYLNGGDREIADQYCPKNALLGGLFDEIDLLHIEIDRLILIQDFENAELLCKEEDLIRIRIDAILFALVLEYVPNKQEHQNGST